MTAIWILILKQMFLNKYSLQKKKKPQLSMKIVVFLLQNFSVLFLFRNSSVFLQCLIEQIQYLPVDTSEFIRSPLLNCFHSISIDTEYKSFIFRFFSQLKKMYIVNWKLLLLLCTSMVVLKKDLYENLLFSV